MNQIFVYRTHIEVTNYHMGDCRYLEKKFSIYDMTYHKYFAKGMYYNSETEVLMLPRGMDIGYLERAFQTQAIVDTTIDPYTPTSQTLLKFSPRDGVQREAIHFMLGEGAYKNNKRSTMISVNLNTGKGKTYCAIAALAFLGLKGIVITDSIDWLKQWHGFITQYTNIQDEEIYYISGAPSFMKMLNRDTSKYKVFLSTHSTLHSIATKHGWDKVREFFIHCEIGVKFFDEAHLNFDNMFMIDCHTNAFMTYYLTATPGRSDMNENSIYGIYFKNVPSINLFNKEEDAHTKYVAIRYNSAPNPIEASKCKNKYGLNRPVYTNYVVEKENFHYLMHILIDMALKKPGKHLFYIGTNEAILRVRDWIYENYPQLIGQVGVYTSITNGNNKRDELEKKIILSTTKSAGAAMDIKGLVETVNLAEPFKSRVLAQQTLGRTRDDNTVYKDIVDNGFYYAKRFYEFKKPVFSKYATDCIEITLSNQELADRANKAYNYHSSLIQPLEFQDDRFKPIIQKVEGTDI